MELWITPLQPMSQIGLLRSNVRDHTTLLLTETTTVQTIVVETRVCASLVKTELHWTARCLSRELFGDLPAHESVSIIQKGSRNE